MSAERVKCKKKECIWVGRGNLELYEGEKWGEGSKWVEAEGGVQVRWVS